MARSLFVPGPLIIFGQQQAVMIGGTSRQAKVQLVVPGGECFVYAASSGGAPISDLTDLLGNPIAAQTRTVNGATVTGDLLTADPSGNIPSFMGPDSTSTVWVDPVDMSGTRFQLFALGAQGPQGVQGVQGVQGIQGQQGNTGPAGPSGINPRGPWSSSNSYAANDWVSWGGSAYYAISARAAGTAPPTGTSSDPGSDDTAVNSGWGILTIQGAQGIQGIQGIQGVQGVQGNVGPTGPAGLVTRGAWASANSYAINDLVSWSGSAYYATAAKAAGAAPPTGTSGSPATDPTAVNTGWSLLTQQGIQGVQGNPGTTGPAGGQVPTNTSGTALVSVLTADYVTTTTANSGPSGFAFTNIPAGTYEVTVEGVLSGTNVTVLPQASGTVTNGGTPFMGTLTYFGGSGTVTTVVPFSYNATASGGLMGATSGSVGPALATWFRVTFTVTLTATGSFTIGLWRSGTAANLSVLTGSRAVFRKLS